MAMPDSASILRIPAPAVTDFLASASEGPSALIVEGEPGIGKTTLWLAARELARERGFRVLSARPGESESGLVYAALADLLSGIDEAVWAHLPEPQRLAIDRVLLRAGRNDAAENLATRAVAVAFLSVVQVLAEDMPVLVAVDDMQWIDPASADVLAFAARRLSARVALLATLRSDPGSGMGASWLELARPDAIRRVQVRPLSLGALAAVITDRLGRAFSRPTMVRIHQISGGNPFYALELARTIDGVSSSPELAAETLLPDTLAGLVRARICGLAADVRDALLAAACLAAPTVELVARATDREVSQVVGLLEDAERAGILRIDGHRLRFAHPLLATGVHAFATPDRRRVMHGRLAEIVDEPETQARHLALAAAIGDSRTWASLDEAAEMARLRGAPAAAAELIDLAVRLGGDTPERRIRLASYHFATGDLGRARALLEEIIDALPSGALRAAATNRLAFVQLFDTGSVEPGFVELALTEARDDPALRVELLVALSAALACTGDFVAAGDRVENALDIAERLGQPNLLSQTLGMQALLDFMRGNDFDESSLRRAVALEDRYAAMPMGFRPSVLHALLLGWTGQLEPAHDELVAIRRRCIERGEESELMFVALHSVLIDVWRGDFTGAAAVADDAMERALQLGGELALCVALTIRAVLAAYAGRVDEARRDIAAATGAGQCCGSFAVAQWPSTIEGFLEVSLGNYAAAITRFEPLITALEAAPDGTEIAHASFVPDAVEALINLGRIPDAESLVAILERNGRRLDRVWMRATGARCRAMLLAARGDVDAATVAAQRAMAEHDRVPMPFERARTQLLLGQLQRRLRQKETATANLGEVLRVFDDLGTSLWARRAQAELSRSNVAPNASAGLTPSEQQVADLAAAGMTNRDVAAALFISPKTVEANLVRIYRKLGIRSRAELGRQIGQPDRSPPTRQRCAGCQGLVQLTDR